MTFGNEKFTITENIELLTHNSLKIMKEGPHQYCLYKKTVIIESNDTYKVFCKPYNLWPNLSRVFLKGMRLLIVTINK